MGAKMGGEGCLNVWKGCLNGGKDVGMGREKRLNWGKTSELG